MSNKELADLIFPNVRSIEYWFEIYKPREDVDVVLRFAPSPTGFLHTGAIYTSILGNFFAHQNNGKFILRIEDTDQKREVEGAKNLIISGLNKFDLDIDEGPIGNNFEDIGEYGPYTQSHRKEIYHSFAKWLIQEGKAYPCWMGTDEIDSIREQQKKAKIQTGIYGNYAKWRNKTSEEYIQQYKNDKNCTIRFRSNGDVNKKIIFDDINRGKINMTDNYNDIPIIKQNDGLPTYHLAHVVDDTLMRVTHITRGEEWLTSVPLHLQLFDAFGFKKPVYCHVPNILKLEDGKKRKLSKRKDPEAGIQFLLEQGYSAGGIKCYLLSLIDSGFETWFNENIDNKQFSSEGLSTFIKKYNINLESMTSSGALFDLQKLLWWNNKYLSVLDNNSLFEESLDWFEIYDKDFFELLNTDVELGLKSISIERHTEKDPKRFNLYQDVKNQVKFMYNDERKKIINDVKSKLDSNDEEFVQIKNFDTNMIKEFIKKYEGILDLSVDTMGWFTQLKEIGKEFKFAENNKQFKEGGYIGKIGELAMLLRVGICGSKRTPDLFSVMKILGKEEVFSRLKGFYL